MTSTTLTDRIEAFVGCVPRTGEIALGTHRCAGRTLPDLSFVGWGERSEPQQAEPRDTTDVGVRCAHPNLRISLIRHSGESWNPVEVGWGEQREPQRAGSFRGNGLGLALPCASLRSYPVNGAWAGES